MSATIQTVSTKANVSPGTIMDINAPSGVVDGDLLIAVIGFASGQGGWNTINYGTTGFTELDVEYRDSGFLGGAVSYKTASSEPANYVFQANNASDEVAAYILRIDGHSGIPEVAPTNGNSATLDCPSHTPSGGSKEYLWLALGVVDTGVAVTGDPTNYTEEAEITYTAQVTCYAASRLLTAASENPGTASLGATDRWVAWTASVESSTPSTSDFVSVIVG